MIGLSLFINFYEMNIKWWIFRNFQQAFENAKYAGAPCSRDSQEKYARNWFSR